MRVTDLERRVRQVAWPAPSPDLRARVLSEASVERRTITWADRVWFSRAWRLGMAGATLVLFTIRLWPGPHGTAGTTPTPWALTEAQVIEESGRQAGLTPDVAAALARRALAEPQARPMNETVALWLSEGEGGR